MFQVFSPGKLARQRRADIITIKLARFVDLAQLGRQRVGLLVAADGDGVPLPVNLRVKVYFHVGGNLGVHGELGVGRCRERRAVEVNGEDAARHRIGNFPSIFIALDDRRFHARFADGHRRQAAGRGRRLVAAEVSGFDEARR